VVVTHDQEEAMTLASRIGVMHQGFIAQVGTPHEIYEFPATRFVADFIGNVNMFEGRIVEDEPDHVLIECAELAAPIYIGHGVSAAPNAIVWVAVRPEKLQLTRARPDGQFNMVAGVVKEIAYVGDMSIFLVQLACGTTLRVTQANSFRQAEDCFTWEDAVWVSWHESSAVVVTQ
jgi:putrescine transport system ATP-binding protein